MVLDFLDFLENTRRYGIWLTLVLKMNWTHQNDRPVGRSDFKNFNTKVLKFMIFGFQDFY